MSACKDDDKLLEKYKTISNKIRDLKNNKNNIVDSRYVKSKIRTYGEKVYTNFLGLNMLEDGVKWESFTIISIVSFLIYENKYYLKYI